MRTLFPLSLQRVTHSDPVVYSNEERYRIFRDSMPVMLGNSIFSFPEGRRVTTPEPARPIERLWTELENSAAAAR